LERDLQPFGQSVSFEARRRKESAVHLILTKISFAHGFTGMAQYWRNELAGLASDDVAVVVVSSKKSLFAVESSRLTVVTDDNINRTADEIEANHREFDADTSDGERIYIGYARMPRTRIECIASGTAGRMSLDEQIVSELLQRKAA